jgi:hypothetical protein
MNRPLRSKSFADVPEKELQSQLFGTKVGIAKMLGWACYHTLKSKGSEPGFPDWTIARDRVVFVELKTEKNTLSDSQVTWIKRLDMAGAEVYVVRPRHLEAMAWVLAKRYRPRLGDNPHGDGLLEELDSVLSM